MTTLTANISTFALLSHAAKDTFETMKNDFVKRRLMNRTVSELDALNNYDLKDLGISRGEIKAVARQAVYGI